MGNNITTFAPPKAIKLLVNNMNKITAIAIVFIMLTSQIGMQNPNGFGVIFAALILWGCFMYFLSLRWEKCAYKVSFDFDAKKIFFHTYRTDETLCSYFSQTTIKTGTYRTTFLFDKKKIIFGINDLPLPSKKEFNSCIEKVKNT